MSALPTRADIRQGPASCPLSANSGHALGLLLAAQAIDAFGANRRDATLLDQLLKTCAEWRVTCSSPSSRHQRSR
jgi:hypothetical protein